MILIAREDLRTTGETPRNEPEISLLIIHSAFGEETVYNACRDFEGDALRKNLAKRCLKLLTGVELQ